MMMNSGISGALLGALVLLSVSCSGDPRRGGIFFDPSKAEMRLAEKRQSRSEQLSVLADLNRQLEANIRRESQLKQEIADIEDRIAARRRAAAEAGNISLSQADQEEILRLLAEKAQLEKELEVISAL